MLALAIPLANAAGAVIVFVFANFAIPIPDLDDESKVRLVNLAAFTVYMSTTLLIGLVWSTRRMRPLWDFLREERDPAPEERRMLLRGPLRLMVVNGVLWGGAVVVFGVLNTMFDPSLGLAVAITVALAGLTTCAVAYLLTERILRAAQARAMAAGAPERPAAPGVASRSLISWALGTGVPLLGLILVALYAVTGEEVERTQLAITVLVLGGLALIVGVLVVVLAARATADPITSVRDALARVERGDLEAEVPVYDASEMGLLQAGFNRMVEGLRDRERIREAFGTYVDRDVAEHILREDGGMEGEEIEVTLMFLDVRDFTAFAERSPPRDVVSTLNRLFEQAVPIVRRHGGHVDKFVGDGLLAVFGAPRPDPAHADKALAAAREIAAAVEREFEDRIRIGIGLNSGSVVAGSIGGAGRLEFSVIGDAVNVAARVEEATKETGDTILLSAETRRLLRDSEEALVERPALELKGKRGTATLYALETDPSPSDALPSGP